MSAAPPSPPPQLSSAGGGLFSDLKILWHMLATRGRGQTHEERLEDFYSGQATGYDAFRRRLLHGRDEMFAALPTIANGVWVDLGAGTGENAERWGERLGSLKSAYLVDLSSSLLQIADERIKLREWSNVQTVHADATQWLPPEGAADVVTFSYSLTMIPDWFAAIDQAFRMLKPGGTLGVVDFFVARKHPAAGLAKHSWLTRSLWPVWFATDNVFPNADHLPYLQSQLETVSLTQRYGKIPYVPLLRAPHYWFVGRKPVEGSASARQSSSNCPES